MALAIGFITSIFLLAQLLLVCGADELQVGFYKESCPYAEYIVKGVVQQAFVSTGGDIAAGLLRMHFHDCFVEGCDASVLLDGPDTEKTAAPNLTLDGFDIIDEAKCELEKQCPGIVSCADIVAFAARDSVVLTKGLYWDVAAGRRDGTVSEASRALKNVPSPVSNVWELTADFAGKGLSQDDMITLSGAHTIGVAHCASFINRLYNFSAYYPTDPTLEPKFAEELKKQCPPQIPNSNVVVALDSMTPQYFDNDYYANLRVGKGLLTSDQILYTDPSTRWKVLRQSFDDRSFQVNFIASMIKMGGIGVKTGNEGEIRHDCKKCNAY